MVQKKTTTRSKTTRLAGAKKTASAKRTTRSTARKSTRGLIF